MHHHQASCLVYKMLMQAACQRSWRFNRRMSQTQTPSPVAIVTAAGRGMGAAIARELHARGYRLALMSPSGSAQALREGIGRLRAERARWPTTAT